MILPVALAASLLWPTGTIFHKGAVFPPEIAGLRILQQGTGSAPLLVFDCDVRATHVGTTVVLQELSLDRKCSVARIASTGEKWTVTPIFGPCVGNVVLTTPDKEALGEFGYMPEKTNPVRDILERYASCVAPVVAKAAVPTPKPRPRHRHR